MQGRVPAVRPEKIQISKNRPDVRVNLFRGKVREIAYFGRYNTFMVEIPGGHLLKITETNTTRNDGSGGGAVTWDDPVFVWWDDSAPVVLTQ